MMLLNYLKLVELVEKVNNIDVTGFFKDYIS